ncbi:MAG: hypothetical protein JWQ14_1300 [Adhaeribacter sp.]|jgi:hypothetical protein|nr:hypothetical protein [Adhaeribacter sp.]
MGDRIAVIFERYNPDMTYVDRVPFAIRKPNWFPGYYVVVEEVDMSTGNAFDIPLKNGEMVRLYEKNEAWRQSRLIPDCKVSVWELKEDVDLSYYQRNGAGKVYELHHRLFWSEHYRYLSIEELCQDHWGFIKWSLDKLEKNFCLSAPAIRALKKSGLLEGDKDANWFLLLNKQKLKWYASGLQPKLMPDRYKADPNRRVHNHDLGQIVKRAAAEIKRSAEKSPL